MLLVGCQDTIKASDDVTANEDTGADTPSEPSTEEPTSSPTSEPAQEDTNQPSTEPESTEEPQEDTYPTGPYGWNPSMLWDSNAGTGEWTSTGSTIGEMCLPNAAGEEVCLSDFYKHAEKDIIFLDFSAMWCAPCRAAAQGEHEFIAHLESNGWNPVWITVLLESNSGSPTQSDAQQWAQDYGLSDDKVLYDTNGAWFVGASSGYPTVHVIHNSNMLIWDRQAGWVGPSDGYWNDWLNFFSGSNGLLEYCATQPGAIAQ